MIDTNDILDFLEKKPNFQERYDTLAKESIEIILFGSYAQGCQTDKSDIDILFIGNGKSFKDEHFDFVSIPERKCTLKSWLGSELANHVAKYGVWLKGRGQWKHDVFVSQTSIERKKLLILSRLSHLWVKHLSLDTNAMYQALRTIQLDSARLKLMLQGKAVPPTRTLKFEIDTQKIDILSELCNEKLLGKIGEAYLAVLLQKIDFKLFNHRSKP